MVDLEELKRLAQAATGGTWIEDGKIIIATDVDEVVGRLAATIREEDADFIAAANPAAMLELIQRLEAAEKDAARYRWLRDDNAYWPEEQGITGGMDLDASIDEAIAAAKGEA
jgi:hypothetical protein